jgi:hypothetical protein
MNIMDYLTAMQLLAARSPATSREAAKTIRRLGVQSPIAELLARRLIADGLADPEAELNQAERDDLAALLTGESSGRTLDIRVRATLAEKQQVQAAAEAVGVTVSDYVRQRIGLARDVAPTPSLR